MSGRDDDPYRARTSPGNSREDRGRVRVRLVEDPTRTNEDTANPGYARHTAQVLEAIESRRRRLAWGMRSLGGAWFAYAVFFAIDKAAEIAHGDSSFSVRGPESVGLILGPFLAIAGAAGSASLRETPNWWRICVIGCFALGVSVGPDCVISIANALAPWMP